MKDNILIVSEDDAGRRLDNFLAGRLKRMHPSRVHRMIRRGEVRVNRGRAASGHRLRRGDEVRLPPHLDRRPPAPVAARARWIEQFVVYEDDSLLVLNKPAGLAAHAGGSVSFGAVELLRAARPRENFLQLAHRLDRATSGLLVLARKARALNALHQAFRENEVEKTYAALLAGPWRGGERKVDLPLDRSFRSGGERRVRVGLGQPATTRFRPHCGWDEATLVRALPLTGRTHQIRAHSAAIGHPVLGDDRYGRSTAALASRIALRRLFLHARELRLRHPESARLLQLRAPLPDELRASLKRLGPPEFGRSARKT
ncbi:MAG: RluA family pseudouridine synthase [Gammaproteobacteria bacterium]|nr:RluA family pseudouridine synthase [Gammaproteobacteria bacterium]